MPRRGGGRVLRGGLAGPLRAGAIGRPNEFACIARQGSVLSSAAVYDAAAKRGQALGGAGSARGVGDSERGSLAGNAFGMIAEGGRQDVGVALVSDSTGAPRRGTPPSNCSCTQQSPLRISEVASTRLRRGCGQAADLPSGATKLRRSLYVVLR